MTGRMIHRNAAKRLTRAWQVGAAVVAVAAGALWAVDFPGTAEPAVPQEAPPDELGPVPGQPAEVAPAEAESIASMAERLELARKPANKPAAEPTGGEPPPAETGASWRFLGAIIEPHRKLALVSIDGVQRMVAEGRTIDTGGRPVKLETVGPNAIVVVDDGQKIQIRKEERTGPSVAWVSPTAGGGGVVAGMNGTVPGDGQMIESRAGGMDPAEAQRLREHARRMANRNRGTGAPGQPGGAKGVPAFSGMSTAKSAGSESATSEAAAEGAGDATADGRGPSQ